MRIFFNAIMIAWRRCSSTVSENPSNRKAEELSHQQQLWDIQLRDHRAVEERINMDKLDEAAREVDVAATRSRTKRRE